MRRFLTAAITLGAIIAGVLGVTAPAHAMKEACETEVTGCNTGGADPDTVQPAAVQPLDLLVADAWGVIFGNLSETSLAQLDQPDTQLHQMVTDHHDNLHPNVNGFVFTHTSAQLDRALDERAERNITKLGVAHALTHAQQAAVTAALEAGDLTNVMLVNGASLPTVNNGQVHVDNGGTVTTINGGKVQVTNGGTVTTVNNGKVFVARGGAVTTVDGGKVQVGNAEIPGGTVTTVDGGTVHVGRGGTATTITNGTVIVTDGGTVNGVNGGQVRIGTANHLGGTVNTVNNGTVHVRNGGTVTTVDGGTVHVHPGGTVTTVDDGAVGVWNGGTVTTFNGGDVKARPGGTVNGITRQ